jgi:hypothetical protein
MRAALLVVALAGCVEAGEARLGELRLESALFVRVTDGPDGPAIPARLLFFDGDRPVRFGELDFLDGLRQADGSCWIAPGALGTWDGLVLPWGEARIPGDAPCGVDLALPAGRYRVWAWQGIEFQRWEGEVEIGRGLRALDIALERAFTPAGALAADLHVHAFVSPDSGVPEVIRALTLASAGIRVVALSDHNANGDLDHEIRMTGMDRHLASIASNELGSDWAHVGIYPVRPDRPPPPEEETASWSAKLILTWARAQPGRPIVQVNHPRYRVTALFDLAGWDGLAWPPPFPLAFDAVEVLSGDTVFNAPGDRRLDEGVRDFYTLIDHGALVTAVGNSDTHHLTGIRDGLTRTYVFVDDLSTERFDEAAFVDAVRARRAVATSGPWLDVEVVAPGRAAIAGPGQALTAPDGKVVVDIEVAQADFSRAETLRILHGTGGSALSTRIITIAPGEGWRGTVEVDLDADGWIGVDVGGDGPLPVELTGNVHVEAGRPGAVPFAIVNPILVDADGDGRVRYGQADVAVAP